MGPIEKENRKVFPHNLNEFAQELERLIHEGRYRQAHTLISKIDKKEDIFLENCQNRRKHGVYYTDSELAQFIVQKTVFTFLNEALNLKLETPEDLSGLRREKSRKAVETLLNVSICDPTCGSGNFLINSGAFLFGAVKKMHTGLLNIDIKTQILRNIHGFDINLEAVSLCKLKLIKWFFNGKNSDLKDYHEIKNILDKNIQEKNSLVELNNQKFDIIVGNPPYGNILTEQEKKRLEEQDIYYKDAYCAFLLRSLMFCRGYLGLLIPKSFLLRQSYLEFRNKFLSDANLFKIYNIGSNEFKNATNEVQILIYGKKRGNDKDLTVYNFPETEVIHYQNQEFDNLRACIQSECVHSNLAKRFFYYTYKEKCPGCNSFTTPLNRIRIKCTSEIFDLMTQIERKGDVNYLNIKKFPKFTRGEEAKGLKKVKKSLNEDKNGTCYYIDAKYDFQYFYFQKSQTFNLTSLSSDVLKGDSKEYYREPKLLIKHNNIYPEALFTEETACFTSSIYSILHEKNSELKYLGALLNSVLIHFYCIYAINNQNDTTINLNQYMIRHLPIVNINEEEKAKIAEIVDYISQALQTTEGHLTDGIKENIKTLNETIFKIYNIEKEQQRVIIEKVKRYNPYFKSIY